MSLRPPTGSNLPILQGFTFVNVLDYGARGDGTTDDSAAFDLAFAAANGGRVYIPAGHYRIGDVSIPDEGLVVQGDGIGAPGGNDGTVLQAIDGATYVFKIEGLRYLSLRDLVIDGNDRASRGLLFDATAAHSSQSQALDHVRFYQCTVGLHIGPGAGGVTQVDKNSLRDVQFTECDLGLWVEAANGQETVLHNCNFSTTYDTSIRMSGGSLHMIGGQFQSGTGLKGVEFTGSGVDWVQFNDVIFEGPATDVDGSAFWPRDGVVAINTVFQGSTANIAMGVASGRLFALACRFNDLPTVGSGQITVTGANCIVKIIDCGIAAPLLDGAQASTVAEFNWLSTLAARVNSGSTAFSAARRGDTVARLAISSDGGLQWGPGNGAADTALSRPGPNNLTLATGDNLHLGTAADASSGSYLEMWELTSDPSAPATNGGRIYLKDNGAGKTQLIVRFPTGAVQVIATEP